MIIGEKEFQLPPTEAIDGQPQQLQLESWLAMLAFDNRGLKNLDAEIEVFNGDEEVETRELDLTENIEETVVGTEDWLFELLEDYSELEVMCTVSY